MRGFTLGERYRHRGSAIWGAGDVETAGGDTGDRWAKISSWEGEMEMEMAGARFWVAVAVFLRVRLTGG
jgi:hypothetical protein